MTTRKSNRSPVPRVVTLIFLLAGCGIESDSHYDPDDKKYGVNDANVQSNEAGATVDKDRDNNPVAIDGEDIATFKQDPSEIIFRSAYQGIMDRQTLRLLFRRPVTGTTVEAVRPEESMFYRDVRIGNYTVRRGDGEAIERLAKVPIDLVAEQTAGDENAAIFRQHVNAPFGESGSDLELFADSNETGTQIYDRHLTEGDCPESLVCINRSQVIPNAGGGQTFCYYDKDGKPTAIPVGISPGASYEVVSKLPRQYGPFSVRRFAVAGVDCRTTTLTPISDAKVLVSLGVTRTKSILKRVNADNRTNEPIDFGVTVFVDMLNANGQRKPHNELPYIDSAAGFQAATSYYFNNDSGRLLKIVKTFRKEFAGTPTSAGYQGLVVDIGFRFCKSLLAKNGADFCKKGTNQ